MRYSLFALLLLPFAGLGLLACNGGGSKTALSGKSGTTDSAPTAEVRSIDTTKRIADYKKFCARMATRQKAFASQYKSAATADAQKAILKKARNYLGKALTDTLFPYWYETPWDYNGVTQEPLRGKIACGYFVTTTLQQAGFGIQRVHLAQVASSELIRTLCSKENIKVIANGQLEKVKTYLGQQPDGVYIIGLNNHVGYVVKQGTKVDMVHSSYWPQVKVVRESFATSPIILESTYFMIGNLLDTDETVLAWVKGTAIE